jgi:Anti-sigma-K factor rskA
MNRPEEWADYLDPGSSDPGLSPAERAGLDRITVALADDAVWSEPPAELRAALLAQVEAEAAQIRRPGSTTPTRLDPATTPRQARSGGGRRRAWYASAVAVAAAGALVAVLAWPRPATTTFAMSGTALAPAASATAVLEPRSAGVAITLQIKGLVAAPPGTYYAAWMQGTSGVVPVGTFHWHKGGIPIELWSGVTGDRYPDLFVTLQQEGRPATPSADVVLRGHVG